MDNGLEVVCERGFFWTSRTENLARRRRGRGENFFGGVAEIAILAEVGAGLGWGCGMKFDLVCLSDTFFGICKPGAFRLSAQCPRL